MTWIAISAPEAAPPASHAPPPLFVFFSVLTLLLMLLRRVQVAGPRRMPMLPTGNDSPRRPDHDLPSQDLDRLDPAQPLAVFLLGGEQDLGPSALRMFGNLYSKEYPQILFVSVGVMDFAVVDAGAEGKGFKGSEEAKRLKRVTRLALDPYLASAHALGLKADCRIAVATDAAREIDVLSDEIASSHPKAVFFVSKLVFEKPRWYHRFLHSQTGDAIRKCLEKKGFPVTVLPVLIPG